MDWIGMEMATSALELLATDLDCIKLYKQEPQRNLGRLLKAGSGNTSGFSSFISL